MQQFKNQRGRTPAERQALLENAHMRIRLQGLYHVGDQPEQRFQDLLNQLDTAEEHKKNGAERPN